METLPKYENVLVLQYDHVILSSSLNFEECRMKEKGRNLVPVDEIQSEVRLIYVCYSKAVFHTILPNKVSVCLLHGVLLN